MATIVLSAAGMAAGGAIGGSVLGLSMATLGRAAGAAIGRRLDQQLLGGGSEPVETGRVDRFRLTGASEGADIQQVYGRMRVAGQVIWASDFLERKSSSGGGKGAPSQPETIDYSYSVSVAIALCEGPISRVGRIWADGEEIFVDDVNMRVYEGSEDQEPDPKIAAVEGADYTPSYRGTAYVVLEDLSLGQFGNRVPQFTFEVFRPDPVDERSDLQKAIKGVALIPGTGEYSLATTPVYMSPSFGTQVAVNSNSTLAATDIEASLNALQGELPACESVVLVVSWFGNDLRCATCDIEPKVEQQDVDADAMPWRVSSQTRASAKVVPYLEGEPVYGGTPTDTSVVEAIRDLRTRGLGAVFYPFILMEQLDGNTLPNPWTGEVGQPVLPWRGRITTSLAPNLVGSPDGANEAVAEVAAFMGEASVSDFTISGGTVTYSGPEEWSYRRFILHYAYLCAAAGGVDAFCLGSEMRALTQIRGPGNSFPAVEALRVLAAEVRSILGSECKISYAADWSEYHGYQPAGTADKFFHLDALWADQNIDFIGVDNYMPLSDWRDGSDHADAAARSIYDLDYLTANVAGGEGYDWYYGTPEARDAQRRTDITDGDSEPWVWRYKDFQGWWSNLHRDRIDGVRQENPTDWIPQSKPIWFTEFGCAAIDKGANQPNKFLDPKSSESTTPYYSNGGRDDFMQMQYFRAVSAFFDDPINNPTSSVYGGQMVDTGRMHAWAWDARPYPFFPNNRVLWSDGDNYAKGHWLNGRASNRSLASVVAEICERSGVEDHNTDGLFGVVRGYSVSDITTARSALQPLMLGYGFDASEREGKLQFRNRSGTAEKIIPRDDLAVNPETDQSLSLTRAASAEIAGRVQVAHLDVDGDYAAVASEADYPDQVSFGVTRSELPLALTRAEGDQIVSRWLQEARAGRDLASFSLPPSGLELCAGDVVSLQDEDRQSLYRIDRVDDAGVRLIEASQISSEAYSQISFEEQDPVLAPFVGPTPVEMVFLDLPLLTGDEVEHAPHIAVTASPWPGDIALYGAAQDSGYALKQIVSNPSVIGQTRSALLSGPVGIWDRQAGLEIELVSGALSSATAEAILSGANTIAIGDGVSDQWEILQFRDAVPIAPLQYRLDGLLRGQLGTWGLMPSVWPSNSVVVVLDGTPEQLSLRSAARGLERHYRYGPASRPMSDQSYRYEVRAFAGNGLRPYPVAHLQVHADGNDLVAHWIRCSRIDGDIWTQGDIPLGEDTEEYVVRVLQNGVTVREMQVFAPEWRYPAADIIAEVGSSPFVLEVSQVSARFGAGLTNQITVQA